MDVPEELVYNFIIELKKKEIDPVDRAKILREYIKQNKYSIKQFSKETGIPTATIHDWINYEKITKEEYTKLIDKGYTKTEVFKTLRNSKYKEDKNKTIIQNHIKGKPEKDINIILREAESKLRTYITNLEYDSHTIELIKELRNTINRIEIHIERKTKGG